MSDVLIDLGEARVVPPPAAPPGPRAVRPLLAALAVLLVATLTGSVHRPPPAPPKIVAARLGDSMFVGADRFYLVAAGAADAVKTISTYGLPAGDLLARTTVTVPGAIFDVTSVGDTVLVSYQVDTVGAEATVALRAGTSTRLWQRPARLLGVSAPGSLVLLRENSPQFGSLRWYGIDLATGAIRYQLEQPVGGYITETTYVGGFPRQLVTVDADGRLQLRDSATGAITASTTIAVPADWARQGIALWPDGDLILAGDHSGTTAYGLPGLTARWRSPIDLYSSYVGPSCGDAVCFFSPRDDGVHVLDRATGQERWASTRWSYADQVGPYLLAGVDAARGANRPLNVVDLRSGRVLGDFGAWQRISEPAPDGTVVALRDQPGKDTVFYARLDPARLSTRILGTADHVSGDCQTTATVLVCRRTDASVGIWSLA